MYRLPCGRGGPYALPPATGAPAKASDRRAVRSIPHFHRAACAPFKDSVERATDPHEQHRQAIKTPGTISKNIEGPRIGVVMADIDNDIHPQPAAGGDRFIERRIEFGHKDLEIRALATRPQTDPRTTFQRCDLGIGVDTEIHPDAIETLLNGSRNARLPRSGRAVQDDDLASFRHPCSPMKKAPSPGPFFTIGTISSFWAVAARGCACRHPCPWALAFAPQLSSRRAFSPRPSSAWVRLPALPSSA
jgi:hypothetical protein